MPVQHLQQPLYVRLLFGSGCYRSTDPAACSVFCLSTQKSPLIPKETPTRLVPTRKRF